MLFRKRKPLPPELRSGSEASSSEPMGYHVDFNMMLKGRIYDRGSDSVRQYGVTVRGSTRLVTSGEWVDRETYEALVEAGAITADPATLKRLTERKKGVVSDIGVDMPEPEQS